MPVKLSSLGPDEVEELIDELEARSISIAHDLTQPCSEDCTRSC